MKTKSYHANHEIVRCKPGPYWSVRGTDGVDDVWFIHAGTEDRSFASMAFWDSEDGSKGRMLGATAKLLAAAPQLLETMKLVEASMVGRGTGRFGDAQLYWLVRAAVEMAETRCNLGTDDANTGFPLSETDFGTSRLPRRIQRAISAIYDYLWIEDKANYVDGPWSIGNIGLWWTLVKIKALEAQLARHSRPRSR
jgi:hypothetical protein